MTKNKTIFVGLCLLAVLMLWQANGALLLAQGTPDPTPDQSTETTTGADSAGEFIHNHDIDSAAIEAKAADVITHDHENEASEPEEDSGPPGIMDFLLTGKYLSFILMAVAGLILLLGRWIKLWVRIAMMVLAFVLFGLDIVYALHPSPMCAIIKLFLFKMTHGVFYPAFVTLFLLIMIPSLIGRKLFCGWVCPLGAFQELINKIPFKPRWKNFNFTAFNAVRFVLLGLFFLTFFYVRAQVLMLGEELGAETAGGLWNAYSAYSLYDPINFFELLHWQITTTWIIMMIVLVAASLMLYRPFCYSICPIGALTWLLEKVAPGRIRVDHNKCTKCGMCEEESPCPTIKPLREGNFKLLPDCTSCGECIKTCPEDAIRFKFTK